LGAQPKHGLAAATDDEYIEAAVSSASSHPATRVGCFFIPGIGTREQLTRARDLGVRFIRIGTNAVEVDQGLAFIAYAREIGLTVCSNLMKSYVLSPFDLCRAAEKAAGAGAQVVVLVDSAGGMLPEEVTAYVSAMRNTIAADIGFHGHNNLGLANACALSAIRAGARFVDVTLQGMGRSAGNASTEGLLLILEKLGHSTGIDYLKVLDAGEEMIRPRLGAPGFSGITAISGYALFHSSYTKHVQEACASYDVDPRVLIIEVSRIDRNMPSRELFLKVAAELAAQRVVKKVHFPPVLGEEKRS
jgi:4-hydroxy 2-oxovalerate aldolase